MKEKTKITLPNIKFPVFTGFEPGKCYIKPMFYEYENLPSEFLAMKTESLEEIVKYIQETTQ